MNWTGYFIAYAIAGIVMTLLFAVSLMNIAKKSDEQAEQIFDKFKRSKKAPVAIAGNWHNKSMDSLLTQEAMKEIMKEKTIIIEGNVKKHSNLLILDTCGSGKCHHPWDNLKPCSCGCNDRPLLMYEKNKLYVCGGTTESVFAICGVCGRHTENADITTTIDRWNNDEVTEVNYHTP